MIARLAGCLCGVIWLAACSGQPDAVSPAVLTLGTAVAGSGFLSFGEALKAPVEAELRNIRLEVLETDGALDNVRGLTNGTLDLGFVYADIAFEGIDGRVPVDLRALAVLQVTPMHLVASPNSGVKTVADLRRKRVAIGRDGTGTLVLAETLLGAYGIGEDIERFSVPLPDALDMVRTGRLDALFNLAAYSDGLARTLAAGARLVPIQGAQIDALRRTRPFLRRALVPAGTYPGVAATPTVGVETLLVCRASLDNAIAHDVAKAFVNAVAKLPAAFRWSPVPAEEAAATALTLHPGAARYFREEQLRR